MKQVPQLTYPILAIPLMVLITSCNILKSQSNASSGTIATVAATERARVTALGRIEPKDGMVKLTGPSHLFNGRVSDVRVQEGDWVTTGQVIAVLDNVQKQEALKEAAEQRVRIVETQIAQLLAGEAKEGEIAAQSAKIAQLRAEFDGQTATQGAVIARLETELSRQQTTQTARVARLRAEVANAEAECSRYESLLADGAVSASTRDTKCLAANTADERLNEAQADKDRILGTVNKQLLEAEAILTQIGATYPQQISQAQSTLDKFQEIRAVDIDVLTAQLNEAQIRLAEAEADLELSYIRSPLDGQIVRVYTSPGESIGNEGIVDLAQTQEMYVVAEVYETDIKQIQLGQTAQMSSLALSNQLTGSVEQIGQQVGAKDIINTDPTLQVDARVVEVKIKLDELAMEEAANLINLEVDVQIEVGT